MPVGPGSHLDLPGGHVHRGRVRYRNQEMRRRIRLHHGPSLRLRHDHLRRVDVPQPWRGGRRALSEWGLCHRHVRGRLKEVRHQVRGRLGPDLWLRGRDVRCHGLPQRGYGHPRLSGRGLCSRHLRNRNQEVRRQVCSDRCQQWLWRCHAVYGVRFQRSLHGGADLRMHVRSRGHDRRVLWEMRPGPEWLRRNVHLWQLHRATKVRGWGHSQYLWLYARVHDHRVRGQELWLGSQRLRRHLLLRLVYQSADLRRRRQSQHVRLHALSG
jgi:hypothetical protein